MSPGGLRQSVIGRQAELAQLEHLLSGVPESGDAVLVEGPAGIGKSTLASAVGAMAAERGFRELRARGVPGGGATGYGALHELVHPVLGALSALPPRQRAALMVAFGQEEGPAPDRLLLGLATLGLLEESSAEQPLLVVVEDLHWLDRSSADVIAFLARRLGTTPALLVATSRVEGSYVDWSGAFPNVLRLEGLSSEESGELLTRQAPDLGRRTRERVLELSAGNPLALIELPAALRAGARQGRVVHDSVIVPGQLPMTERLEQAFLAEVGTLPEPARRVLLIAAAGEDVPVKELVAAGRRLGLEPSDITPAEKAGLLGIHADRATFRHPLIGSAVYRGAASTERAQVHRALAAVATEPDRSARHRAAATYGWDEEVAARLVVAADGARQRGAHPEAVVAYRRAAALSPALEDRAGRLAMAAEAARRGGLTTEAAEVLHEALPLAMQPSVVRALARTEWVLSMTAAHAGRSALDLLDLARDAGGSAGSEGRAEILLMAATKAFVLAEPAEVQAAVLHALDALPPGDDDPLRDVGVALLDPARGTASLRSQIADLAPRILDLNAVIMNVLAFAAEAGQDLETADRCWSIAADHHHDAGRIADEATAVCGRALPRLVRGDLEAGLADAEQALRLSLDFDLAVTGAMAAAGVALGRAMRGEAVLAERALVQVRRLSGAAPFARVEAVGAWAAGLVAMGEGRHDDAVAALEGTAVNKPVELWAGQDLVEAAIRARRPEAADRWLADAGAALAAFPDAHGLASAIRRSQALLADDADAEARFREALESGELAGSALVLGRARLLYGEWLRRRRRIREAREQLAAAVGLLDSAGAGSWAGRARAELAAAGARRHDSAPRPDPTGDLTAQELQVARLAARGLSNSEIADQLYLSHRTVAAHLNKVFPKLGVVQRAQLSRVLAGPATSP